MGVGRLKRNAGSTPATSTNLKPVFTCTRKTLMAGFCPKTENFKPGPSVHAAANGSSQGTIEKLKKWTRWNTAGE